MKVTYVCDLWGGDGEINLNEGTGQLDMDPLTVDLREDIIKSTKQEAFCLLVV